MKIKIETVFALGCLTIIFFICFIPFVIFWGIPIIGEIQVKWSLNVFDGSEKIYEDLGGGYWGNSAKRSLYYSTDEPIETVQNYYEDFTTPFVSAEYWEGKWLTAFLDGDVDVSSSAAYIISSAYNVPSYPSCSYRSTYNCVTVVLVDASQDDYYRIGVMSPTTFKRQISPPEFDAIPNYGTIIVYSYFVVRG